MNQLFPTFKLSDPVWRTIARKSELPVSLVYATYMLLYEDATDEGELQVSPEDLATALDEDESVIFLLLDEMQDRVIDGSRFVNLNSGGE